MRDSQRSKLYQAETVIHQIVQKRFDDIKSVQDYVDALLMSGWFREHFPRKTWCQVLDGRRRRRACGINLVGSGMRMKLPRWTRFEAMILHELAHCITPTQYAAHGPEFASIFVRLVARYMGEEAFKLLTFSFRDHGVRYLWIDRWMKSEAPTADTRMGGL